MATQAETAAMRRAIRDAHDEDVPPGPNPRVGAVVLAADDTQVAAATHRGAGSAHAEALALANAGDQARGATVVVSLEPCRHAGRTGPCTQAIIDAGVRRVVYAQADPNPAASGGADVLRSAGIDVEGGVLADEAVALNPAWTFAVTHQRPFVTWKLAATVDGRSAAADGTSQWVTGPAARADVHRLRACCDTVLVGTGTVVADDPRLTVRTPEGTPLARHRQPLRAVMGLRRIPDEARVFDDAAPTVVLDTRDPADALKRLFGDDRRHVWLEGGPRLAAAFLSSGYVDEVVAYIAPAFLGSGHDALTDIGVGTIDDAVRLELMDLTRVGNDVRLTMRKAT